MLNKAKMIISIVENRKNDYLCTRITITIITKISIFSLICK